MNTGKGLSAHERAERMLNHYLSTLWRAAGLHWDSEPAMRVLVDVLIEAAMERLLELSDKRPPRRFLTATEVAVRLAVDPKTVARWGKTGQLPCVKTPGGHRRYPADVVEALAQPRSEGAAT